MTVISSVIAYFTYHLGYSLIEASEATVFDYLKPVIAAPVAVLWLGEKITLPFLIGAGIIALGVFLTESRPQIAAPRKK
jgi:drug/metabolite transporter (DMT)-like permease